MPFSGTYTPGASSPYGERTLASHKQTSAASGVQPPSSDSSSLTTLSWQVASLTRSLKNLTEFPFAHNFSKPDLEGL